MVVTGLENGVTPKGKKKNDKSGNDRQPQNAIIWVEKKLVYLHSLRKQN